MGKGRGRQQRQPAAVPAPIVPVTPADLPALTAVPAVTRDLDRLFALLTPALATGSIPNPRYQDLKRRLATVMERAIEVVISVPYLNQGRYAACPPALVDALANCFEPRQVAATLRAVTRVPAEHPLKTDAVALLRDLDRLTAAVASLRDRVVKRPTGAAGPAAAPAEPPASRAAWATVTAVLTDLTNAVKDAFADQVTAEWTALVGRYAAGDAPTRTRLLDETMLALLRSDPAVFAPRRAAPPDLAPGWEAAVRQRAVRLAETMQQQFIARNGAKLAPIVEAKGNLLEPPRLLHAAAGRVITGEIAFTFADGSHFVVRHKVVHAVNRFGRAFLQFPTTFHHVVLPNGQPLPRPSEARLRRHFAPPPTS